MKLPQRFRNGSLSPNLYIDLHGLFGVTSVLFVALRSLSPKHEWHQPRINRRLRHRPHISGCGKRVGRIWFPWRWLNQLFHIHRLSQPTENLCCAIWKGSCKAATASLRPDPSRLTAEPLLCFSPRCLQKRSVRVYPQLSPAEFVFFSLPF